MSDRSNSAFRNWFKKSVVVDHQGEPLVVYHGTPEDFESFDLDKTWKSTLGASGGLGIFFTRNRKEAEHYAHTNKRGGRVIAAYLSIQRPKHIEQYSPEATQMFNSKRDAARLRAELIAQGYDGAITHLGEIVAFYPQQIKSVDNDGTWDSEDTRMASNPPAFDKAFWDWFGESQAVDERGRPLLVYHGTPDKRFLAESGVFQTMKERYGKEDPGRAFFFTSSYRVAATYADERRAFDYQGAEGGVISAYLSIQHPLIIDNGGKLWRNTIDRIAEAKLQGYDGVIITNTIDDYVKTNASKKTSVYVIFDSRQIKVESNDGTWDKDDPDVRSNPPRAFNVGLKDGQFMTVQYSNGMWLGMDGKVTDAPNMILPFQTAEEANRWAATCSFAHLKRTKERLLWRIFVWNKKDLNEPAMVSRFVTVDESVFWNEEQMIQHPHLFGFPKAKKEL